MARDDIPAARESSLGVMVLSRARKPSKIIINEHLNRMGDAWRRHKNHV